MRVWPWGNLGPPPEARSMLPLLPCPRHPLAQKIFTRKSTRTGWIKQHGARGFHVLFKQQAASAKQQAGRVGP